VVPLVDTTIELRRMCMQLIQRITTQRTGAWLVHRRVTSNCKFFERGCYVLEVFDHGCAGSVLHKVRDDGCCGAASGRRSADCDGSHLGNVGIRYL